MKEKTKKLVILTGYVKDETYGLLGPQMAATIINAHSEFEAIVVGVTRQDNPEAVLAALNHHFGNCRKVVAFSCLGGRPDLFDLARKLKEGGSVTLLAGPQAGVDYKGEIDWQSYPHRFKGLSDSFSFALQGPAQQILPILAAGPDTDVSGFSGVVCQDDHDRIIENPSMPWAGDYLSTMDWKTLHILHNESFLPKTITCAQVLQQIGCPHAAQERKICVDYPQSLRVPGSDPCSICLCQKGCSFCDVAADKGYMGPVDEAAVKEQLRCLPHGTDNRKIPFELINESPLFKLARIFEMAEDLSIDLSRINLTLRADYLLNGLDLLEAALDIAVKKNVQILLSAIGFESFDDTILKNGNVGCATTQVNNGNAKVAFCFSEHGFTGCQRIEHEIADVDAGLRHTLASQGCCSRGKPFGR